MKTRTSSAVDRRLINYKLEPMDLANTRRTASDRSRSYAEAAGTGDPQRRPISGDLLVREFGPRMVCTKCGSVPTPGRTGQSAGAGALDGHTMAQMNDERLRALRLRARHPAGCAEAVLVRGCSVGQLAVLVLHGFAKMYRTGTDVGGRQRSVIWMEITEEGRQAVPE